MSVARQTALFTCLMAAVVLGHGTPFQSDPPTACSSCDGWNAARESFRVYGNTYYVGVAGLSSVLIAVGVW